MSLSAFVLDVCICSAYSMPSLQLIRPLPFEWRSNEIASYLIFSFYRQNVVLSSVGGFTLQGGNWDFILNSMIL